MFKLKLTSNLSCLRKNYKQVYQKNKKLLINLILWNKISKINKKK
jgi:hypothetical protein